MTDTLEEFTPRGLRLGSGAAVDADVVVMATGYNHGVNYPMQNIKVTVDGAPYYAGSTKCYKDIMLSDVPNFAYSGGYFHQSNILAVDLALEHVCGLLQHMDKHGHTEFCPRWDPRVGEHDASADRWWMPEHNPNYYSRLPEGALPGYGATFPWLRRTDPLVDMYRFATSSFDDGYMQFK